MINELKFIAEENNSIDEQNYFNISQNKNEYIERKKMPINYIASTSNDAENEDPNEHLMSPYFRGNTIDNPSRMEQQKDNRFYEGIGKQV